MPELVAYNEDGSAESVAYQVLPSLLLNEYQRQARELAAEKASRIAAEARLQAAEASRLSSNARLEALEGEMASIKLMLARLANAQSRKTELAAAP